MKIIKNLDDVELSDHARKQAVLQWFNGRDLDTVARTLSPNNYFIVGHCFNKLRDQLQGEIDRLKAAQGTTNEDKGSG